MFNKFKPVGSPFCRAWLLIVMSVWMSVAPSALALGFPVSRLRESIFFRSERTIAPSVCKYLYANASPLMFSDPTGHFSGVAELSAVNFVIGTLAAIAIPVVYAYRNEIGALAIESWAETQIAASAMISLGLKNDELIYSTIIGSIITLRTEWTKFRTDKRFRGTGGKHHIVFQMPSSPSSRGTPITIATFMIAGVDVKVQYGGKPGRVFSLRYYIGQDNGQRLFQYRLDYLDYRTKPASFFLHQHLTVFNT